MLKLNHMFLSYLIIAISLLSCSEDNINNLPTDPPVVVRGNHDIIPLPVNIDFIEAVYVINSGLTIRADDKYLKAANVIQKELIRVGLSSDISNQNADAEIEFVFDANLEGDAYRISIKPDTAIQLFVNSEKSAFYASQSLRQYIWTSDISNSSIEFVAGIIFDAPINEYRGFQLDVSRHFFDKEFIYKIIDQMALYKLNNLQIHLSDDQGWRVVSDNYPLLTEIGAYREFDENDLWCIEQAKHDSDYNFDPKFVNGNSYGGFYTKQDLRDIVAYAAKNYIDVIPEIDMPGHMSAAIRAYSWISCNGNVDWGSDFSQPMCVYEEDVMQFAKDIWDEMVEIFPSERVHIGADEVDKSFWENDPNGQQFMEDNNWPHVNYIQNYFVSEITSHLEEKGKKVTAWDDILVSNDDNIVNTVSPTIDIMYWRDYKQDGAIYAAQNGNKIILTPWSWFYLSSDNTDENFIKMYNFNETNELDPRVINNKIGYQACVWTERIPSEAVFEKFVFPRFQAFSEVAWSRGRDFNSFKKRLKSHLSYMDEVEINYRKPDFIN